MNFRAFVQLLVKRGIINGPDTDLVYWVNDGFILKYNGLDGRIKKFVIVIVEGNEYIKVVTDVNPHYINYFKNDDVTHEDFEVYKQIEVE